MQKNITVTLANTSDYMCAPANLHKSLKNSHNRVVLTQSQPQAWIKEEGNSKSLCCYKLSHNYPMPTSEERSDMAYNQGFFCKINFQVRQIPDYLF